MVRLLGCPIPETRTEPVRNGPDLQRLEQSRQGHVVQPLAAPAREHERVAVAERPGRIENLFGAPAQRHAVLALRLGPRGRGRSTRGPPCRISAHCAPTYLAGPRRREHEELECELHHGRSIRTPAPRRWPPPRRDGAAPACAGPDSAAGPGPARCGRHGLSALRSMATAHSMTVPIPAGGPAAPSPAGRAQTARSVSTTSVLVTSDTGSLPSRGNAKPGHARHPVLAVLGVAPAGPHLGQDLLGRRQRRSAYS